MIPALPGSAETPAPALHARRCVRHPAREAVARCPGCGGSFCRECVVEHGDRLLCATCLARELAATAAGRRRARRLLPAAGRALALGAGALTLWLVFYGLGSALLRTPPAFHDGTIWQNADQPAGKTEDAP